MPKEGDMIPPMATISLEKILPTLEENSKTVRNTYISYLAAATFIWITIESVTHRMLLIPDERLTLPVIQVQIPIVGFFATAPALLLMFQFYFQIHVYNFAKDLAKVRTGLPSPKYLPALKMQLIGNLFTWNFLDTKNHYTVFGFVTHLLVSFTFFWYGAFVLLRAQWLFLPYHHSLISHWEHRVIVLTSVAISTCFAFKIWALRNGQEDDLPGVFRLIGYRLKLFKPENSKSFKETEHEGWEKFIAILHFIFGSFITVTGIYFFISMSGFILKIPFDQKENNRPFSNWTLIPETVLAGIQQKETFQKILGVSRIWLDLVSNNGDKKSHFKINDLIDRNLQLAEAKLALAPSDTMKAAIMKQEGKNLSKEKMEEVFLEHYGRLDLKNRHLEFANFFMADLRKADLRSARLQDADLSSARLQGVNFEDALLQRADLGGARLQGADLSSARLQGAILLGMELQGANLFGNRLQGADLRGVRLQGANLRATELQGANLSSAQLQGADLSSARLQGADLSSARLQGADLSRARLQGADLSSARFQGVNLDNAQLQGADLSSVELQAADLREAKLLGAQLSFTGIGPLVLDDKDNNPEKWAKDLPEEKRDSFINRLRQLAREKTTTRFPRLEDWMGNAIIAHNIQDSFDKLKDVKNPVPSLVDFEKLTKLNKQRVKQIRELSKSGKQHTEKEIEERRKEWDKQIKIIFSKLNESQKRTWDQLLCENPILREKKLEVKRFSYNNPAPYFSRKEVQAAIDKCPK